jgi:hypothetical protein
MSRKNNLIKLTAHPYLHKLFSKLTKLELEMVTQFVHENNDLGKDEYMHKANRWLINDINKPKHHSDMWAIVTQVED